MSHAHRIMNRRQSWESVDFDDVETIPVIHPEEAVQVVSGVLPHEYAACNLHSEMEEEMRSKPAGWPLKTIAVALVAVACWGGFVAFYAKYAPVVVGSAK